MPSFSTSLSGLNAAESALNVISNNLANLNTTAYKEKTANFGDLFYQYLGDTGSGNPIQVGEGVAIDSVSTDFTQGNSETTGMHTDMAIEGNGFFVVQNNGAQEYTRAGNFTTNTSGFLVDSNGAYVMGYAAANGVLSPSQTLTPLQVTGGSVVPAKATTEVELDMNLDATASIPATGTFSFSQSAAVYDSLGVSHTLTFNFANAGNNQWTYQITIPAADVGSSGSPAVIGSGTLQFDGSGKLTSPATNVAVSVSNLSDGANDLSFNWQLYNSKGSPNVTETGGASAASNTSQDGFSSGSLTSFNVTSDGIIHGVFSNGQTTDLGQVALANFSNPQGLTNNGGNDYTATFSSGAADIGGAGLGGRGDIRDATLEQSNVDMATEFANLIMAERDYQANAKAITTADNVAQTAINLIP
jgi:flagellar hook protein FlgE